MEFLSKNKYLLLNYFNKTDQLNIQDKSINRVNFGGKVMSVNWRTEYTKFDIYDYVKVSKKQRSNEVDRKEKKVLNYNYTGICIAYKKDFNSINAKFVLRNVFDSFPLEMTFPLYSPQISGIALVSDIANKQKFSKNRLYFLRNKEIPLSKVIFNYVFD